VQAGDEFYLHVDEKTGEEFYFRRAPDKLPSRWIWIERVCEGFVEEATHSSRFYKWERRDLCSRLAEFADDDLVIAVPHGAGWVEFGETMGGRTGDGTGILWKRRRPIKGARGGAP
jgi:hypothetical protein